VRFTPRIYRAVAFRAEPAIDPWRYLWPTAATRGELREATSAAH